MNDFISGYVGSALGSLAEPDSVHWDKIYSYERWDIKKDVGSLEEFYLTKKRVLGFNERVFWWLDMFSNIFPERIIEDAKRIAFDVKNTKLLASRMAVVCLKISNDFHLENDCPTPTDFFKERKDTILQNVKELRKEKANKDLFVTGNKYFLNINKHANIIKEELGVKKFDTLKKMWEGIHGC